MSRTRAVEHVFHFTIGILVLWFLLNSAHEFQLKLEFLEDQNNKTETLEPGHQQFSDIVVLFQYNWVPKLKVLEQFLEKWSVFFKRIVLAIPVQEKQNISELYQVENEFIKIKPYLPDRGFISPLKNLVEVIDEVKSKDDVAGVLQMHDDMLLNMTSFFEDKIWKQTILTSESGERNRNFSLNSGVVTPEWGHWKNYWGLKAMKTAENDIPESLKSKLARNNLSDILWFSQNQADFTYLPISAFENASLFGHWLSSSGVMIEIAYPMMIQNLELNHKVKGLNLCTSWSNQKRKDPDEMARLCDLNPEIKKPIDLIHPVKPGLEKLSGMWLKWYDRFTDLAA